MLHSLRSPRIAGPRFIEIGANVEALFGRKISSLIFSFKGRSPLCFEASELHSCSFAVVLGVLAPWRENKKNPCSSVKIRVPLKKSNYSSLISYVSFYCFGCQLLVRIFTYNRTAWSFLFMLLATIVTDVGSQNSYLNLNQNWFLSKFHTDTHADSPFDFTWKGGLAWKCWKDHSSFFL